MSGAIADHPAILGIGTDLLAIARMELAYERKGMRLVRRILSEAERDVWQAHATPVNFLAKAFAAKEALSKALGTGISQGVSFQDFTITRSELGQPVVTISGAAQRRMDTLGGRSLLLSLSDDGGFIQAFAVLSS